MGKAEQAARHGDQIDPEQNRSAHAGDDSDGVPRAEDDLGQPPVAAWPRPP